MITTPEILWSESILTAKIHFLISRSEIRHVMGPGLSELMGTLARQGVETTGPWLNHHLHLDPNIFDFEITVPVSRPVTSEGRVEAGEMPRKQIVRTIYCGPYEGLVSAWGEFGKWFAEQQLQGEDELWEAYLVGPESGSDPKLWRTELNRPLRDRA